MCLKKRHFNDASYNKLTNLTLIASGIVIEPAA